MRIYLDVCCLNRPFDDQVQDRIRLESEAVLTILSRSETEGWALLGSEAIDIEISKIPDENRRQKVSILASTLQSHIVVDEDVEKRAMALAALGFKSFDSLHVACAEKGRANVLLTTDDKLVLKGTEKKAALTVRLENPVKWLMEEIEK